MTEQSNPWGLTPREIDVAEALIVHRTNRGIASALCVELRTVEGHIRSIKIKMGLSRKAAAAAYAPHAIGRGGEPAPPRTKTPTLRNAINAALQHARPCGMGLDELHRRVGIGRTLLIATLTKMRGLGLIAFHQVSGKRIVYWPGEQAKTEGMPILLADLVREQTKHKEVVRIYQKGAAKVARARVSKVKVAQPAELKVIPKTQAKRREDTRLIAWAKQVPVIPPGVKKQVIESRQDYRFAVTGPVIGGFKTLGIGRYLETV